MTEAAEDKQPKPEAAPDAAAPATAPAPAGPMPALFSKPALIVAAATFAAVLGTAVLLFLMIVPRGETRAEETSKESKGEKGGKAVGSEPAYVTLVEDCQFTTTLPPTGDRSVTYEYSITVKVAPGFDEKVREMIDPKRRNMLSVIQAEVRQIIAQEDYLKLRANRLEDVKRRIQQHLNTIFKSDAVLEVIFAKWNVYV
jgi:flagellar basal body-associated protein FliL